MPDQQSIFWIIWRDDGGTPTYKHFDIESARREAERLAVMNPGKKFHVLQLAATCQHNAVQWTSFADVIPF